VLLPINEAKVRASEDTAFRTSPLRQVFGDMGNQEAEDAVLAGTYQTPPGTPRGAQLFLQHAKKLPGIVDSPLGITTEDHISAMKKSKEATTGGLSGLHVGMFKANSKVPELAQLDASMRSLPNYTGCSHKRSQTCADVQLHKRFGNINAKEHRTICVSEIYSNATFKLIGKQAMWNGKRAKALTRDNLGGRKGMHPVEVSMNQHLLYNLIRAKWGRAVTMSKDAWGCYDRIAHIAVLLALRRLGIPRPPDLSHAGNNPKDAALHPCCFRRVDPVLWW